MPHTALVPLLPLLAGAFALPQYLPQLLRVRRLGAAAGVSWTWAALAAVNNLAWAVYFVWSGVPSGLVAVLSCALVAGLLTREITRLTGGLDVRRAAGVGVWVAVMATAAVLGGRLVLGAAMNVALLVQVVPSVVTAWRSEDVTGISVGTWLLVMGELTCFGLFGLATGDVTLLLLGVVGDLAGVLMLTRVAWAGRQNDVVPDLDDARPLDAAPTRASRAAPVLSAGALDQQVGPAEARGTRKIWT